MARGSLASRTGITPGLEWPRPVWGSTLIRVFTTSDIRILEVDSGRRTYLHHFLKVSVRGTRKTGQVTDISDRKLQTGVDAIERPMAALRPACSGRKCGCRLVFPRASAGLCSAETACLPWEPGKTRHGCPNKTRDGCPTFPVRRAARFLLRVWSPWRGRVEEAKRRKMQELDWRSSRSVAREQGCSKTTATRQQTLRKIGAFLRVRPGRLAQLWPCVCWRAASLGALGMTNGAAILRPLSPAYGPDQHHDYVEIWTRRI